MIKGMEKCGPALAAALKRVQSKSHIFGTMDLESLYTAMKNNKNFKAPVNTIAMKCQKNIGKLHRAFLRNVLSLYTYSFIYLISTSPEDLTPSTQATEKNRMNNPKTSEDMVQEVYCDPPVWLKSVLPRIVIPDSVAFRSSHSWVETGAMANSFTFFVDREQDGKIVTGYAGFLKKAIRHKGTAQQRAEALEYGKSGQIPRPLLGRIYKSDMFRSNYKKLLELLTSKLPANEMRAITFSNKVDKHLRDLAFVGEEAGV